jgi:hypothetical protein
MNESGPHLLRVVRENPEVFLARKSLVLLAHFWEGATFAAHISATDSHQERFSKWISIKFGFPLSRSAFSVLRVISGTDEQAFDRYFDEADKFDAQFGPNAERFRITPIERPISEAIHLMWNRREDLLTAVSIRYLRPMIDGYCFVKRYLDGDDSTTLHLLAFAEWASLSRAGLREVSRWEEALVFSYGNERLACDKFWEVYCTYLSTASAVPPEAT